MIALAILGLVLRSAPVTPPADPTPVCDVIEWVTPWTAIPSPNWCEWPAVSSWPLMTGGMWSVDRAVREFAVGVEACHRLGGKVIAVQAEHPPTCAGVSMFRSCLRAPMTAWRLGDWIDPGTPERGCGDVVLELLPRDECETFPDCRSLPFGDGRLWFSRTEVDEEVW